MEGAIFILLFILKILIFKYSYYINYINYKKYFYKKKYALETSFNFSFNNTVFNSIYGNGHLHYRFGFGNTLALRFSLLYYFWFPLDITKYTFRKLASKKRKLDYFFIFFIFFGV